MFKITQTLIIGTLILTACTLSVSAGDAYFPEDTILYGDTAFKEQTGKTFCEQLFYSSPVKHHQIIKTYFSENQTLKPETYVYGERLKVTAFEDGTLSVVTVSISENTKKDQMFFFSKLFAYLGLHKTTDIYTITRTDYSTSGDILIKISLSGWFETGPHLPKKAHFVTFKPEYISEEFDLVSINGGESPTAKLSGSLLVEKDGIISSYDIIAAWIEKLHYTDTITYPQVSPTEGDTGIFWILHEDTDKQITAKMTLWFSFDGKTAPKAHLTEIQGISHKKDYDCTAQYFIDEDTENGQTIVTGTVTARNIHESEDIVQYILKAYCTKYGYRDSSTYTL